MAKLKWFCFDLALKLALYTSKKNLKKPKSSYNKVCVTYKAKQRWQVSLVSVRKLTSQEQVGGEKRVAVKPLLKVQCPPMSLEKVWQAILRQFLRYVRIRENIQKTDLTVMRYCGHFLIKAEGGAKNNKRDHPLPLSWRPFTVVLVQLKGYIGMRDTLL